MSEKGEIPFLHVSHYLWTQSLTDCFMIEDKSKIKRPVAIWLYETRSIIQVSYFLACSSEIPIRYILKSIFITDGIIFYSIISKIRYALY